MKELKGGRTVRVRELGRAGLGHGDGAQLRDKCTLDVLLLGAKKHHAKYDGFSTAVARASRPLRWAARSSMQATSAKSRQTGRQ